MLKLILIFLIFLFQLSLVNPAFSASHNTFNIQQPSGAGVPVNPKTQSAEGTVTIIVKNLVYIFFAIGAIGTLIMFLWGAVEWILSGGDKEKVASARKRMTQALVGLLLLALSFVILRVVSTLAGFNIFQPLQIRGLGNQNP